MITLALDTSTAQGAVAVLRDDQPLAEQIFHRDQPGDHLFGALQNLLDRQSLAPSAIDRFVVGLGPGSFTGIRAGIAAVRGLARPHDRPIKGISSFDAVALTALPRLPRDCPQLCVLTDARRDEVYYALYDRHGKLQRPCRVAPLEGIADEIHNPLWFVGPAIDDFADELRASFGGFATVCDQPVFPSAAALGWLGVQGYRANDGRGDEHLEPLYLRETSYKRSA